MSGPVCPHCGKDIYDACFADAHDCSWLIWEQCGEERFAKDCSGHTAADALRSYVWFEYDYSRRAIRTGTAMHFYVRRRNSNTVVPFMVQGEWRPEYLTYAGAPIQTPGKGPP